MAGDWIKMRADLLTHPKVVRISSALKVDRLRTIGALFAAWCLFDAHSEDGTLPGYTDAVLNEIVGLKGFAAAMRNVGWLQFDDDGLTMPEFEEHNGKSAKIRAEDSKRKRKERTNVQNIPDKPPTNSGPEKRREEKNTNTDELTHASGDQPQSRVSIAGAVCIAMKAHGIGAVNPGHPDLIALIDAGAEIQNFVDAARIASDKGKGFAYVLGTVKGQMQDASKIASAGLSAVPQNHGTSGGQARANRMAEAIPALAKLRPAKGEIIEMEAHDVPARSLG